ncbi:MAG: tetratricopeptide repeat protein [Gemmatimonadota bacterium]
MAGGSFESEIAHLSQRFARNPTSRLFAPLADAHRKAGRIAEAIGICQQGLRVHPDYLGGKMVLARAWFDQGDLEEATGVFREVLEADPQNLVALRALGEIGRQRGDASDAAAWFRRALEVDPTNGEIRERLEGLSLAPPRGGGDVFEQERAAATAGWQADEGATAEEAAARPMADDRFGRAEEPERSVDGDQPEEIATVTLAEIYADQGLHERALAIYRRILAEDPANGLIRDKAERLERQVAADRERLDAEAGSSLGGFVPGELQLTGDELVTGGTVEGLVPAGLDEDAETGQPVSALEQSFPSSFSRRSAEPWAFLLEDEADHDPDDVFGRRPGRSQTSLQEDAGGGERPAPEGSPASSTRAASAVEDEDLRKFQEWLRSLQ